MNEFSTFYLTKCQEHHSPMLPFLTMNKSLGQMLISSSQCLLLTVFAAHFTRRFWRKPLFYVLWFKAGDLHFGFSLAVRHWEEEGKLTVDGNIPKQ